MPNRSIFHSNEEDTTLGGRISMARETSGLSVDQVVKRLGVRATTYEAWEADRSEPRANKLVALAGILNISPPYLLSGLGKQPSKLGLPERQIRQLTAQIEQLEQNLKTATVKPAPNQKRPSKDEIEPLNERFTLLSKLKSHKKPDH